MLDKLKSLYPQLGFALYAIDPKEPVTLEVFPPEGGVFTFKGQTARACATEAFPELMTAPPEPGEEIEVGTELLFLGGGGHLFSHDGKETRQLSTSAEIAEVWPETEVRITTPEPVDSEPVSGIEAALEQNRKKRTRTRKKPQDVAVDAKRKSIFD